MNKKRGFLFAITTITMFCESKATDAFDKETPGMKYNLVMNEYIRYQDEVCKFGKFREETIALNDKDRITFLVREAYPMARRGRTQKYILLVTMYSLEIIYLTGDGSLNDHIYYLMVTVLDTILERIKGRAYIHQIQFFRDNLSRDYPRKFIKRLNTISDILWNNMNKPPNWSKFDTTDRLMTLEFFGTLCVKQNDFVVDILKSDIKSRDELLETLEKIEFKCFL
ncbi:uncharacterized protein LOC126909154 [Daktulosphaira vitifoliae]|uniref:uncharacterized protein LOC126909154 n=1 Tax=Daktulosphaira vitifoliae TaxID=58002 RepID=UPI0021AA994A|nr:uncharacterized protein LOC126909154 [Daktulosphaira vitifoliae]